MENTYHLRCKLLVKTIGFEDTNSEGKKYNGQTEIFLLIPNQSDQLNSFIGAWLNDGRTKAEVIAVVKSPFSCPGRFSFLRASKHCDTFHLFTMSTEIEGHLKRVLKSDGSWKQQLQRDSITIDIEVQPSSLEMTKFKEY